MTAHANHAVIEAAASLKLLLYLSIIGCVFTPWGVAVAGQDFTAYAVSIPVYALKLAVGGFLLAVFETGVRYQMYHAIALLAVDAMMSRAEGRAMLVAGWSFIVGILIFSGSLYALALSGVTMLGAITPIGGLAFLAGWVALAIAAF